MFFDMNFKCRICYLSKNYRETNSAGNKAKTDIERVMAQCGFHNVGLPQGHCKGTVAAFLYTLLSVLKGICSLQRGDVLVLQYPLKKYYVFVCRTAHLRGCRLITLIHDLGSFRRKKLTAVQEIKRLNHSDVIIAHSEAMKQWLQERHTRAELVVLGIFDYLSDSFPRQSFDYRLRHPFRIVFAGSLSPRANGFIYEMEGKTYLPVLYGNAFDPRRMKCKADYNGFVSSDELIATVDGDFGLVWYGSALRGGEGVLGEYLPYNVPHKVSLYIRCGLPVIIWSKAALASFVREQGIGICVDSLEELDALLPQITPLQYRNMCDCVATLGRYLAKGYFCQNAIQKAYEYLTC